MLCSKKRFGHFPTKSLEPILIKSEQCILDALHYPYSFQSNCKDSDLKYFNSYGLEEGRGNRQDFYNPQLEAKSTIYQPLFKGEGASFNRRTDNSTVHTSAYFFLRPETRTELLYSREYLTYREGIEEIFRQIVHEFHYR